METGLKDSNYNHWFQTLMWIEEMQMEIDIRNYDITDAQLKKVPKNVYSAADCYELMVNI